MTHGSPKPLTVSNQISSPVKPSAPQIDNDNITMNNDVGNSSNLTTTLFHTANQSPSLYPTLSNVSEECKIIDQPLEASPRKRHSSSISNSVGKKACTTKVQQSWFSHFLRK